MKIVNKRRNFIKSLAGVGVGFAIGSFMDRLYAQAETLDKIYLSKYRLMPFNVLVFRDSDYAVAIDKKGKIIAKSTNHANVFQSAIDYVYKHPVSRGGKIYVVSDEYVITERIQVKGRVFIDFGNSLLISKLDDDAVIVLGDDSITPQSGAFNHFMPCIMNVNIGASEGYEGKAIGVKVWATFMPIIFNAWIRKMKNAIYAVFTHYPLFININFPNTYEDGIILGEPASRHYVQGGFMVNMQGGYGGSGKHAGIYLQYASHNIIHSWTVGFYYGLRVKGGYPVRQNWIRHHSERATYIISTETSEFMYNWILLSNTGGGSINIQYMSKPNRIVFLGEYYPSISTITPTESPYEYINNNPYPVSILIIGGDPTIEYSPDGENYYTLGEQRQIYLPSFHRIRVTFTTAPTIYVIPLAESG